MTPDALRHSLFTRARNLERELGIGKLFLKFEGSNPTGTQKDRIARAAYEDAHAQGYGTITLATCGNFGAAIAHACSSNGIRPVIFVPTAYHTPRVPEMEWYGGRVVRVPGDYEAAVAASRRAAATNGWYDANPGGARQWDLARNAYGDIGREIVDALGASPATVSVSVGNGTTLAGVFEGIRDAIRHPGTGAEPQERLPRFIAASTLRGNPIVKSWKRGLRTCHDLLPSEIRETTVNEPLVNWHAFDGQHALDVIWETDGYAEAATDRDMRHATRLVREREGVNVLTASAAALVALSKVARAHPADEDWQDGVHVIVLTGRSLPRARHVRAAVGAGAPVFDLTPACAPEAAPATPRIEVDHGAA